MEKARLREVHFSGDFLGLFDFPRITCSLGIPQETFKFNKIPDFYNTLVNPLVFTMHLVCTLLIAPEFAPKFSPKFLVRSWQVEKSSPQISPDSSHRRFRISNRIPNQILQKNSQTYSCRLGSLKSWDVLLLSGLPKPHLLSRLSV